MRTFSEALNIIQEANSLPIGYSRGIKECPKCGQKTGKDDKDDYGDCKCGYRKKSAQGAWDFKAPEQKETPRAKIPEKPDQYGMFKKSRV